MKASSPLPSSAPVVIDVEDEDRTQINNNNNNNTNKSNRKQFSRSASHPRDELMSFRSWLKWLCVDQSNRWTTTLSWIVFLLFTLVVPSVSHYALPCVECDAGHYRPFDGVVQLSLCSVATLSFLCLSRFVKKFGLRRFLFFDKLCDESETVRKGYTQQLHRSLSMVFIFVLPCFGVEILYKIWWYTSGGSRIPFLGNPIVSDAVSCILELLSWFYRTVVFFLVCVLFRLICYLQILRLEDFAKVFQAESDVQSVLKEHLRIRRQLRIISHRYRGFILGALVFITASQLTCLLLVTMHHSEEVNLYKGGELALCSVSLLAGLMILLRSATRITHKAQAVTCLAAKWHVCASIDSFDSEETEKQAIRAKGNQVLPASPGSSSDAEDVGDEEDELDNSKFVPHYTYSTISFQRRQALVTYFENNRAGVTIYGFVLDRGTLYTIFGLELSLVMWLLGKTVGVS